MNVLPQLYSTSNCVRSPEIAASALVCKESANVRRSSGSHLTPIVMPRRRVGAVAETEPEIESAAAFHMGSEVARPSSLDTP